MKNRSWRLSRHPIRSAAWRKLEWPAGYVHRCLHDSYLAEHDDPTEIEYYFYGPMMIDSVVNMLDSLGVDPEMIAYDKFWDFTLMMAASK